MSAVTTGRGTTKPLGTIPTQEIREIRIEVHNLLDPLWKERGLDRTYVYKRISDFVGYEFHVGAINSIKEAEGVAAAIVLLRGETK